MNFTGNVYSKIIDTAASDPQRTLFGVENEDLSGADFIKSTELYARALLTAGCRANDKIGMILPNSASWFSIYWAIIRIGCIPVPFDPQAGEWELKTLIKLTGCKICFAKTTYRANNILNNLENILSELPELSMIVCIDCPSGRANGTVISLDSFLESGIHSQQNELVFQPDFDDILMMACTSGSTGNPKIIAVPHFGFAQAQKDMADYLGFCKSDIMLLGMPLYHQGGFGMGLQMILNGGTIRYQPQFDPVSFLKRIEKEKITVLQLTATLAKILLSVPELDTYNLKSVRIAYFAGEKLPMDIAREFFENRGIRVVNVIGSTETATMVVWDSDFDRSVDVNDFRALEFTDFMVCKDSVDNVDVHETGIIYVHTDALLSEYHAERSASV
jgi:fatty-acyl-CoA synthase